MSTVLVTGAGGFVGTAVCPALTDAGHVVRGATRRPGARLPGTAETVTVGDLGPDTDWAAALDGVDTVVHLAARVHQMGESGPEAEAAHQRVNVAGTRRLGAAAAAAGVRRFVFLSSVKVNGEATTDRPFRETDLPVPEDAYARAKLAAEQALADIGDGSGMTVVVLRPPLVYGPGVGGNMQSLLRLCGGGLPLPLGRAGNRRSLIGRTNLAAAVRLATEHPAARGTYLVRDGEDMSVADLIRRIRRAMGRPPRLWPVPPGLLRAVLGAAGRGAMAARLLDTLTLDDAKLRNDLGWIPPCPADDELAAMTDRFARESG